MAFGAYGTTITDILQSWADFGVFAYVLPFLMIFAVVFGILNKTKILGDHKGVQATIAIAIGLLSLQFDYVANFFATIFPYAGMGIAVLLIGLILMGLVAKEGDQRPWIWFGLGFVIFIIIILSTMSNLYWLGGGYIGQDLWRPVLAGVVIFGIMALIVFWGGGSKKPV